MFPVVYHSFYSFLRSLAFFALSEMCFPKVPPSWLTDQPCPMMGPLEATGTGCAQHMAALASLTSLLLPASPLITNGQGVTCSVTKWREDAPSRALMVLCGYLTLPAEWSDHYRTVAGKFPVALESGLQLKLVGEISQITQNLNFLIVLACTAA